MTENHGAIGIDINEAQVFLANQFDGGAAEVVLLGDRAWSRCFGFRRGNDELVIRFGHYLDDFQKDRWAYRHATIVVKWIGHEGDRVDVTADGHLSQPQGWPGRKPVEARRAS